jgi:hypothetical protein
MVIAPYIMSEHFRVRRKTVNNQSAKALINYFSPTTADSAVRSSDFVDFEVFYQKPNNSRNECRGSTVMQEL